MALHLYALLVAASTLILILAGGFVTSTGSGLAVPDWPNTYGWFMFAFPLEKMVGGIYWEHGHRLIASTVGFLITVLAFWLWRAEPRAWVRRLGFVSLAAVITQGILGGITVLWFLPDAVSIAHAGLAQVVFCLTVAIALVTSPGWKHGYADAALSFDSAQGAASDGRTVKGRASASRCAVERLAIATTVVVYLQILAGATMRHTDAGLAIPDFPLAFGRLVPPAWDAKIAVHFAHRVGALVVASMAIATAWLVLTRARSRRELVRPSLLLIALVCLQVTLGAFVVWSAKQFVINSIHVATGAVVLGTSLVLALRANRGRFGEAAPSRNRVAA